jgi:hypothetical protein
MLARVNQVNGVGWNFVWWPSSSLQPARKDHITDWHDDIVKRGPKMKSWNLEPVAYQLTEPVAVTHYRLQRSE